MRKRRIVSLVVFSALFLSSVSARIAHSEEAFVSFITGNSYQRLDENTQEAYIGGMFDGMSIMTYLSPTTRIASCMRTRYNSQSGVTVSQLRATVNLYLSNHPAEWNQAMSAITIKALGETCGL